MDFGCKSSAPVRTFNLDTEHTVLAICRCISALFFLLFTQFVEKAAAKAPEFETERFWQTGSLFD